MSFYIKAASFGALVWLVQNLTNLSLIVSIIISTLIFFLVLGFLNQESIRYESDKKKLSAIFYEFESGIINVDRLIAYLPGLIISKIKNETSLKLEKQDEALYDLKLTAVFINMYFMILSRKNDRIYYQSENEELLYSVARIIEIENNSLSREFKTNIKHHLNNYLGTAKNYMSNIDEVYQSERFLRYIIREFSFVNLHAYNFNEISKDILIPVFVSFKMAIMSR